jgi:proteasome maturation protein
MNMLGNVYGAHVPMRQRMELGILSNAQRLPGLPSSNFGMEILLNKHEDLEFDDFLNDPQSAAGEMLDIHLAMEKRLGMDRPIGKPIRALELSAGSADAFRANRAVAREA